MSELRRRAAGDLLPVVAALLGFALQLLFFRPGFATSDTLAQFEQARAGIYDDVHPPVMAAIWRLLLTIGEGTEPLFCLIALVFWSGLARCVKAAGLVGARAAIAILLVGLWPAVFLLLGQVWKDVALAAVLLHGAASALQFERTRGVHHAVIAILVLALATALRHNAWPAVLPFAWLLAQGRFRLARFAALALALLLVPSVVARVLDAQDKQVWTTLPVFDLGAVSAATGETWLPASIAPTLTPTDAQQFHRSWSNVALVDSGKVRISFFVPYTDEMRAELVARWRAAITTHPGVYLLHRYRVFEPLLLGPQTLPADAPRELVYSHAQRLPASARTVPGWYERMSAALWRTPLFGLLVYVVAACVLVAVRREPRGRRASVILLASALLYAAPLLLVAVASEYRYVYWSVLACLLGIAVSLCSRSENPSR